MTKVTWKGEDELHGPHSGGPNYLMWREIKFPKGVAVNVNDPFIIEKARTNQYFKVEDGAKPEEPPPVVAAEPEEPEPPVQEERPRRGGKFVKRKAHGDED